VIFFAYGKFTGLNSISNVLRELIPDYPPESLGVYELLANRRDKPNFGGRFPQT